MTTFQIIVDSVLRVLSGIIPFSYPWISRLEEAFLGVTPSAELELLSTLIVAIGILLFFRYDWLALFSALIKSLFSPTSLKAENRTLDQEILLFSLLVSFPSLLLKHWFAPLVRDLEFLNHSIAMGVFFLLGMGLVRFAYRWNRRIRGLNHLRLVDTVPLILISILNAHPSFPLMLVLWLGFSFANYHYEAIFKYSMILAGIRVFSHLLAIGDPGSIQDAFMSIGVLNGIAAVVLTFTLLWMTLDHLQKQFSENTLRSFQWLNLIAGLSLFLLFFLKG